MKKLSIRETAALLEARDRFAILTHRRPDGDTTGSAAALCLGLRQKGKTAWVLENPELTDRFSWLHRGLSKPAAEPGDTLVTVDVASPGMLLERHKGLLGAIALRIDHHSAATSFTEAELVEGASASCAEVVWEVLAALGVKMDAAIATAVYVGVSTDTGCFRYANTTARTFRTAAQCAQAGADIYGLNQQLFETNTLAKLKMQGWIAEHLRMLPRGMAICAIPKELEASLGVTEDDMDNISSFPRTVAGVRLAATLRETGDGCKLSVRAVPGLDATLVTCRFGGGGHKGAAGATISLPLAQAADAVEAAILETKWTES